MTTDVVPRLRDYAQTMGGGASHFLNKAAVEAADEIEHLRALLKIASEGHYAAIEIRTYLASRGLS